jgi:hypothetical protein
MMGMLVNHHKKVLLMSHGMSLCSARPEACSLEGGFLMLLAPMC